MSICRTYWKIGGVGAAERVDPPGKRTLHVQGSPSKERELVTLNVGHCDPGGLHISP